MMSGAASPEEAQQHGAELFIEKPFTSEALSRRVEEGLAVAGRDASVPVAPAPRKAQLT